MSWLNPARVGPTDGQLSNPGQFVGTFCYGTSLGYDCVANVGPGFTSSIGATKTVAGACLVGSSGWAAGKDGKKYDTYCRFTGAKSPLNLDACCLGSLFTTQKCDAAWTMGNASGACDNAMAGGQNAMITALKYNGNIHLPFDKQVANRKIGDALMTSNAPTMYGGAVVLEYDPTISSGTVKCTSTGTVYNLAEENGIIVVLIQSGGQINFTCTSATVISPIAWYACPAISSANFTDNPRLKFATSIVPPIKLYNVGNQTWLKYCSGGSCYVPSGRAGAQTAICVPTIDVYSQWQFVPIRDNIFYIRNVVSKLYLSVTEGGVYSNTWTPWLYPSNVNAEWVVTINSDGSVNIMHMAFKKYLVCTNNSNMGLLDSLDSGNARMRWKIGDNSVDQNLLNRIASFKAGVPTGPRGWVVYTDAFQKIALNRIKTLGYPAAFDDAFKNGYCRATVDGQCIEYCNRADKNCDAMLTDVCAGKDLNDPRYKNICGCFQPDRIEKYYDQLSKAAPGIAGLSNKMAQCSYQPCVNSSIKKAASRGMQCPSQCLISNSVQLDNSGSIVGNISIANTASCVMPGYDCSGGSYCTKPANLAPPAADEKRIAGTYIDQDKTSITLVSDNSYNGTGTYQGSNKTLKFTRTDPYLYTFDFSTGDSVQNVFLSTDGNMLSTKAGMIWRAASSIPIPLPTPSPTPPPTPSPLPPTPPMQECSNILTWIAYAIAAICTVMIAQQMLSSAPASWMLPVYAVGMIGGFGVGYMQYKKC
jgi:hypothetical protein